MSTQFMAGQPLIVSTRNAGDVVKMDFVDQTIIVSIYGGITIKSYRGQVVGEEALDSPRRAGVTAKPLHKGEQLSSVDRERITHCTFLRHVVVSFEGLLSCPHWAVSDPARCVLEKILRRVTCWLNCLR